VGWFLHFFPDQLDRYRALIEEALALALDHGDQLWAARARYQLAFNLMLRQRWHEAVAPLVAVILAFREVGDTAHVVAAMNSLAEVYLHLGRVDDARQLADEALALARREVFGRGVIWTISTLATVLVEEGDLPGAIALLREGVAFAAERGDLPSLTIYLRDAASVAMALEQPLTAARLLGAVRATDAALGVANYWIQEREDELRQRAIPLVGAEAFAQAVEAGQVVTPEDIITVMEELDRHHGHDDSSILPETIADRSPLA
jgi:tetratricopeptide (TPR) repeat protein